jgi:hypothetical protein
MFGVLAPKSDGAMLFCQHDILSTDKNILFAGRWAKLLY